MFIMPVYRKDLKNIRVRFPSRQTYFILNSTGISCGQPSTKQNISSRLRAWSVAYLLNIIIIRYLYHIISYIKIINAVLMYFPCDIVSWSILTKPHSWPWWRCVVRMMQQRGEHVPACHENITGFPVCYDDPTFALAGESLDFRML